MNDVTTVQVIFDDRRDAGAWFARVYCGPVSVGDLPLRARGPENWLEAEREAREYFQENLGRPVRVQVYHFYVDRDRAPPAGDP